MSGMPRSWPGRSGAEVVHDRSGGERVVGREVVDGRAEHAAVTGVPLEHAVGGGVAPLIQSDAVDLVVAPAAKQGRADLVGLDELEIKRDGRARRRDAGVVDQQRERLAALCPGQPHGAELAGQVDRPRPLLERILDAGIRVGVVSEHLQPGTGADGVVGEREDDALGVGVVGDLVAGAVAEDAPHLGVDRGVGREAVRVRPVLAVLRRGLGRVELGNDEATAAARSASVRSTRRRRGGRGGLRPATDPAQDVGDGLEHGGSDRTGRDDLGELDAEAGLPRGVLGREVAVGLDLVLQRVLLDGLAVDGRLRGLRRVVADGLFEIRRWEWEGASGIVSNGER